MDIIDFDASKWAVIQISEDMEKPYMEFLKPTDIIYNFAIMENPKGMSGDDLYCGYHDYDAFILTESYIESEWKWNIFNNTLWYCEEFQKKASESYDPYQVARKLNLIKCKDYSKFKGRYGEPMYYSIEDQEWDRYIEHAMSNDL